jgi:ABC-type Fe3+-hydroxamate transport system substrate-binding protein
MRIISLCPSLTELVFALGRGEDLVGITHYCVHPAEGVRAIEKVGGTKNPRVGRIIELSPDLVLLNEEENRIADALALEAAGLRCHATLPRNPDETAAMVRSIGEWLERQAGAEIIAREIEDRSDRVRREATGRRSVRFAYLIWRSPWMTVSADTFAHSLLVQAGGENVFESRRERYPEISIENLVDSDPELVLLGTEPFPFDETHMDELASGTDLSRDRFQIVDGEYLSWHGSRTPDGIDYAARVIGAARDRVA